MKKRLKKYGNNIVLFITIVLVVSGMSLPFLEFAKTHGHADRYPQFLMALPLLLIYIIPFAFFTNYLRKRFDVSKTVFTLTWFLALAIPVNIGALGNEFLSLFLLKLKLQVVKLVVLLSQLHMKHLKHLKLQLRTLLRMMENILVLQSTVLL